MIKRDGTTHNASPQSGAGKIKKAYRKPVLLAHGSLAKLTLGGGTQPDFDGSSGMAMIKN